MLPNSSPVDDRRLRMLSLTSEFLVYRIERNCFPLRSAAKCRTRPSRASIYWAHRKARAPTEVQNRRLRAVRDRIPGPSVSPAIHTNGVAAGESCPHHHRHACEQVVESGVQGGALETRATRWREPAGGIRRRMLTNAEVHLRAGPAMTFNESRVRETRLPRSVGGAMYRSRGGNWCIRTTDPASDRYSYHPRQTCLSSNLLGSMMLDDYPRRRCRWLHASLPTASLTGCPRDASTPRSWEIES